MSHNLAPSHKHQHSFRFMIGSDRLHLFLFGFSVLVNHQAVEFLGYETGFGIYWPQRLKQGQLIKGWVWRKLTPVR